MIHYNKRTTESETKTLRLHLLKILCIISTLLCLFNQINAQSTITKYLADLQNVQQKEPREILYMTLDKPSYLVGDTIWFTTYLLDAYEYRPSTLSGIAYVELVTPFNGVKKRLAIHINYGYGFAQLPIDPKIIPGNYKIRAYTRWMENFSDSLFFQKEISIVGGQQNWMMNISSQKQFSQPNSDSLRLSFSLKDEAGIKVSNQTVTLNINNKDGKKIIFKDVQTKNDGHLDVNFNIQKNKKNEYITLDVLDANKIPRITYPIHIKASRDTLDLQFFPESGHLLANVSNNIAFKAIDIYGKGQPIEGLIKNSKGDSIATIATSNKGMGVMSFTPLVNEKYSAILKDGNTFPLPNIETTGTIIKVDALSNKDSIIIEIFGTKEQLGKTYYLLSKNKGLSDYTLKFRLNDSLKRIGISKNNLFQGIYAINLMSENGQLLNERSFFLQQNDRLHIKIQTPDTLRTKDSIPIVIHVSDQNNNPVQGVFTLAVTDNHQVKKDPANDENILSYFLMSADIKGTVESPGYYFADTSLSRQKELDNLMLTQAFVKYNWDTTKVPIPAEKQFQITGKATSLFGKGVNDGNITLMGMGKKIIVNETRTNNKGNFIFDSIPLFDTTSFIVQAKNKKNKTFGIGIELDNQSFPPLPKLNNRMMPIPSYINMDTSLQNRVQQYENYQEKRFGKRTLLDVTVTSKTKIDGSENLNGPGQYDQAITMTDLQEMGDSTLLQILQNRIKGFNEGPCGKPIFNRYYKINGNKLRFVFDGVNLDFFYNASDVPGTMDPYFQFVSDYLKYYTAKDIKGIEIMNSSKYTSSYISSTLSFEERMSYDPIMGCPYSFIEITTYGKVGPFVKHNATIATYRPQPFSYGKEFYTPKYINRQVQDSLPDIRSTIYWRPAIITNKDGEAKLSFYSAASATDYLFFIEGSDLNGRFGYTSQNVEVKDE